MTTWMSASMDQIDELEVGPTGNGGFMIVAQNGDDQPKNRLVLILTPAQREALQRELDRDWVDRNGFGSSLRKIS